MAQYKGQGDPDYDEFVPQVPIVINNRDFNPPACPADMDGVHYCVHDWRCYWGNQKRPNGTPTLK